ncbi:hypothetical protein O3G_MSEX006839 [Manduca sexta]|nr:hypothetical protein O3G_MSEX006839 [Manduca sexta]
MIEFILLLSIFSASCTAELVESFVEPPLRVDLAALEDFKTLTARNALVYQSWIQMPLDHFDPQNTDTFLMRYMFNEEFFGGDGSPIFIMFGGEWDITPGWLTTGNMYEMARENNGYQIYTEHRYYGQSLPFREFTTENLRFLNIDQALADLAYFILDLKRQPRFANSKIVAYGGSYAANMVLWFKKRYPHLVEGGVASSGPILAQVDFQGYLEVVHEAFLLEGGEQCINTIDEGIKATIAAMETEEGRRELEAAYRLCTSLNYDNRLDLGYFGGLISWSFSGAVQTARPGTLLNICNNFATDIYGQTPMQKVGGFIAQHQNLASNSCWSMGFQALINTYSFVGNSRAWYYQTCTEYGFYQTAPRSGTVFDALVWLDVPFYVEVCKQAFTEKFDEAFVYDAADRVNLIYGGLQPVVNNTINIHGYIDPWRALGVYDSDLQESSPTFTVSR